MRLFSLFPLLLLISLVLTMCATKSRATALIVDRGQIKDTFDGIGAVSAGASSRLLKDYPEPYRSQILDFLFLPNYGASLQHLKVEIGGDINSTDGSEPSHMRMRGEENYHRGYQWWLMSEAKKRNPAIFLDALAWGAPGWIGNGTFYSQDMADYMVKFVQGAKEHHGLDIDYVGIWNEKPFDVDWIKLYRATLDQAGLEHVKIVASDMNGPPQDMWAIAEAMVADSELAEAIAVIGVHYAHATTPQSGLKMREQGKRLWSTEDGEWNWRTMLPYRHLRAQKINLNYIERFLTKTEFWSPVTAYYDSLPAPGSGMIQANTPWSGAYKVEDTLWQVAHTTQFVEPGWSYLSEACRVLSNGGSVVALTDPSQTELSIIVENTMVMGENELLFEIPGEPVIERLHVWYSDDLNHFARGKDLHSENGLFSLKTKPRSVYTLTTTTGQRKGSATGPNPAAFPLPYHETFSGYAIGSTPKYLSDQNGAFEVERGAGENQILVQQIHQKGIDWSGGKSSFSILGDPYWTNIEVSIDICFGSESASEDQFASVIARNFQGALWAAFSTDNPSGYNLQLFGDGRWKLVTAEKELASGHFPLDPAAWSNLRLRCHENMIRAYINGFLVSEIEDMTYHSGHAGIGCSFDPVRFDNLRIVEARQ